MVRMLQATVNASLHCRGISSRSEAIVDNLTDLGVPSRGWFEEQVDEIAGNDGTCDRSQ